MNLPLILALLLAAPAPTLDQILTQRARAQANRHEKALQREQVYSRPIALPGATEALTIPLTGKAIGSDGKVYTFSGTVTLSIDTPAPTPTPVPVPTVTKLTGIRDPATNLIVTSGAVGKRLVLEGELLLAQDLLVVVGGQVAAIASKSPTRIEFTVPTGPLGRPDTLILYWLQANNWQEKGRLPFRVGTVPPPTPTPEPTPPPTPPPPPTPIPGPPLSIQFEDGAGRLSDAFVIDHPMVIVGTGFGTAPGRVLIDKSPAPVLAWSSERIVTRSGSGANRYHRVGIDLWTPGAGWVSGIVGPFVMNQGETPLPLPYPEVK